MAPGTDDEEAFGPVELPAIWAYRGLERWHIVRLKRRSRALKW
jgi:hypothetical protein